MTFPFYDKCIGVLNTSVCCMPYIFVVHVPFIEVSLAWNIWLVQVFIVLLAVLASFTV